LACRASRWPCRLKRTPRRSVGSAEQPASRRQHSGNGGGETMIKLVKIREYEIGLYFHEGEFRGLLDAGRYWFFDPLRRVRVDVVSQRTPWLVHEQLDVIVKSGELEGRARV